MEIIIGIITITTIFAFFIFFVYLVKRKIEFLEYIIMNLFKSRTNLIPALYNITEDYLTKHDTVFEEMFKLRRREFNSFAFGDKIEEILFLESSVHHELDFILSLCEKNNKLISNGKFLYIRDVVLERSLEIGKKIQLYKMIVEKYNFLVYLKNITLLGLLFFPKKKDNLKNIKA